MKLAACVLVGLALLGVSVQAAPLGMQHAPVLLLEIWCSTDASGALTDQQRTARLMRPGSTQAGLQAHWSAVLDQPWDSAVIPLTPLPWVDTPPQAWPAFRGGLTAGPRWAGIDAPGGGSVLPTLSDVQAAADTHLRTQAAAVADRLRAGLRATGAGEAWLAFHQQLLFQARPVQLAWNLHVLANGYWVAGSVQLQPTGTGTLTARYVSLAAAQGLPAGYAYRDGGLLQWSVRDAQGQPLGAPATRNLAGGFDGPAGLACLLGSTLPAGTSVAGHPSDAAAVACPAPLQPYSLPQLAVQVGAQAIELDYLDALQPAYAGTTDGTRQALAGLQVDRTLLGRGSDCSRPPWQYRNDYQAAFRLEARQQHFSRTGSGRWLPAPAVRYLVAGNLVPWRSVQIDLQAAQQQQVARLLVDPERNLAVDLDRFAAAIPALQVSAVQCASQGP